MKCINWPCGALEKIFASADLKVTRMIYDTVWCYSGSHCVPVEYHVALFIYSHKVNTSFLLLWHINPSNCEQAPNRCHLTVLLVEPFHGPSCAWRSSSPGAISFFSFYDFPPICMGPTNWTTCWPVFSCTIIKVVFVPSHHVCQEPLQQNYNWSCGVGSKQFSQMRDLKSPGNRRDMQSFHRHFGWISRVLLLHSWPQCSWNSH